MRKSSFKIGQFLSIIAVLAIGMSGNNLIQVNANESNLSVEGDLYEFEKGSKYGIDKADSSLPISSGTSYGLFSVEGKVKATDAVNGFATYEVMDGNAAFNYALTDIYAEAEISEWHLVKDKTKEANGISFDEDILSGAMMIQTSLTGENWVTDTLYTDLRGAESKFVEDFYTSNDIQQVNGCFYRITIVYALSKENEVEESLTNWDGKETVHKKCAEVYEFYLINSSENSIEAASPSTIPRRELGAKINTGKDNGYSGYEEITYKDPHYGWDLGTFFMNGYTRETTTASGNPLFLKNVGDRVALWFNLKEDIRSLNGNSKLAIYEDANGYDQYFEIDKTNFKRGALIIQYTDYEGKTHEPVIYTDYLAANASPGANTKVELFEEGDYEVALNYEILDSKGINSFTNYRIYFQFSIRNGNCMVYPFDMVSGAELSDQALTENGFKLDMAKSRYLTIDVKREVIKSNDSGYVTDERFNRPAKDGDSYSEEGMYTFTVKNLYTDTEPTKKVIYVGSSPVFRAMASGLAIEEINEAIAKGATLKEDGSLELPKVEETVLEEAAEEDNEEASEEVELLNKLESTEPLSQEDESSKEMVVTDSAEKENVDLSGFAVPVVVALLVMVLLGVVVTIVIVVKKRKAGDKA